MESGYSALQEAGLFKEDPDWSASDDAKQEHQVFPYHAAYSLVKEEVESKLEDECELSAAQAALYAGHEVKGELVVGPEGPQLPDAAFALHVATQASAAGRGEPAPSLGTKFGLKDCVVILERLRLHSSARNISNHTMNTHKVEYACPICRKKFALNSGLKDHVVVHIIQDEIDMNMHEDVVAGSAHQRAPSTRGNKAGKEFQNTERRCEEVYACPVCRVRFVLKCQLMEHVSVHIHMPTGVEEGGGQHTHDTQHTHNKDTHSCDTCNKQFSSLETLKCHALSHTRDLTCDICDEKFKTRKTLKKHFISHTGQKHRQASENPHLCKICGKIFTSIVQLTVHSLVHTEQKAHFRQASDLKHKLLHKRKNPHTCKICGKIFKTVSQLTVHSLAHEKPIRHTCDICDKTFKTPLSLEVHLRVHTGEKPYFCEFCATQFKQLNDLNRHKRVHTKETPYSCEKCLKRFTRLSGLNRHIHVHNEKKPHSCGVCFRQFSRLYAFKEHVMIHTGTKPYECKICSKSFRRTRDLKIHRLLHTNQYYSCELCSKKFKRLGSLRTHKRTHTGERYTCNVCKKVFRDKNCLGRHLARHASRVE